MKCVDVESRLDLYAANECDVAESEAIRQHLQHCPNCSALHRSAREAIAMLDLHFQTPDRLQRLRDRLDAEEEPPRTLRFPVRMRHLGSLAAMLLLTTLLGLGLAPRFRTADDGLSIALSSVVRRDMAEGFPVRGQKNQLDHTLVSSMDLHGKSPDELRDELRKKEKTGQLPEPPEVNLGLKITNTTSRELQVWIDGPQTELRLDLHGPGALPLVSRQTTDSPAQSITLAPGEHYSLPIVRLAERASWKPRFWYWTEPGTYSLTGRLTTIVTSPGSGSRRVTILSDPITIQVEGQP
jgi:hypothetical protein